MFFHDVVNKRKQIEYVSVYPIKFREIGILLLNGMK